MDLRIELVTKLFRRTTCEQLANRSSLLHHPRDSERSPLAMAVARKQKMFVLDTNVILHDSKCMYQFEEHDIVIPITVLEELDGFKKGNESVNFHAREFVRAVDGLAVLFMSGYDRSTQIGRAHV